jgi:hypothetical protein
MKVKTSKKTVEELIVLLETFDASTEQFLNDLPTSEKYAVLAMAMMLQSYDDFEEAYDYATRKVSAQDLTKHLLGYPFLYCHLQDALYLKWQYFEAILTEDADDEENDA